MKKKSVKQKKAELKRYNALSARIEALEAQKREMWLGNIMSSPCTDKTPAGAPDGTRTERFIEKVNHLEADLNKLHRERAAVRTNIESAISKLSDPKEREILREMYLTGAPVAIYAVAEKINYSERHTQRLHGEALKHIDL